MKLCRRCKRYPAAPYGNNLTYCHTCQRDIKKRSTQQASAARLSQLADFYRPTKGRRL